jgi:hypothetical protein
LRFSIPSQNVDSPARDLLQPSIALSLYMPVTNPVLAKAVESPRSLALYLPRYFITEIIPDLLIKFSVHSVKQVSTVVRLLTGRHMNRSSTPVKRFQSVHTGFRAYRTSCPADNRGFSPGESDRGVKPQLNLYASTPLRPS